MIRNRRFPSLLILAAYLFQALAGPLQLIAAAGVHDDCAGCHAGEPAAPSWQSPCRSDDGGPCEDPDHRHHGHPILPDPCKACQSLFRTLAPAPAVPAAVVQAEPRHPAIPGHETPAPRELLLLRAVAPRAPPALSR